MVTGWLAPVGLVLTGNQAALKFSCVRSPAQSLWGWNGDGTDRAQSSEPCTALLSRLRRCLGLHAWLRVSRLVTHPEGRVLVAGLLWWTMAVKHVGTAAGRWGEPTPPRVPQDESRKREKDVVKPTQHHNPFLGGTENTLNSCCHFRKHPVTLCCIAWGWLSIPGRTMPKSVVEEF